MECSAFPITIKVYNFKVANTHTYFAGKHSVCVHNIDCGESGPDVHKIRKINGNKKANKFVKQFGYEGEKAAEAFKKDIVGKAVNLISYMIKVQVKFI